MRTGLSGMMCLPTGRPMPERRRKEEATDRETTPFSPMILDAAFANLPAMIDDDFFATDPSSLVFLPNLDSTAPHSSTLPDYEATIRLRFRSFFLSVFWVNVLGVNWVGSSFLFPFWKLGSCSTTMTKIWPGPIT